MKSIKRRCEKRSISVVCVNLNTKADSREVKRDRQIERDKLDHNWSYFIRESVKWNLQMYYVKYCVIIY